jgi:intracellular multiplication protein IcmL
MAEDELDVVNILDNYYRDSFGRVIFVLCGIVISIILLLCISFYIYLNKPKPIAFKVASEWRVIPPIPIQDPYLSNSDVLQWVSDIMPQLFNVDFMNMDDRLLEAKKYFTESGYEVFLNQLSNYVNKDTLQLGKVFVHGEPSGGPFILSQGVLSSRYAWWVQIPLKITYAGTEYLPQVFLKMQILVVRTDTTDNLTGVLIDNIIVEKGKGNNVTGMGG